MKRGLHTKLTIGLALLWAGAGCTTVPKAASRPGVPSGIEGQNLEELEEPKDKAFRSRVEGLTHYLTLSLIHI